MSLPGQIRAAREDGGYDRWTKRTDTPLLILAVLFVVVLVVPYVAELSPTQALIVLVLNIVIWSAFTVDYFARLYLAPARLAFIRTHLLDLTTVALPMLRPLRALRLLRVLRLGAVAGLAHKRGTSSLHARVSAYVLSAVVITLLVGGVAVREAERGAEDGNIRTFADGLWWAATTITTVGYGDRFPVTTAGRLIAVALMLVGIALLGVVTATIAAWFVERLQTVREEVEAVEQRTEATLDEVLRELREVRVILDSRQ